MVILCFFFLLSDVSTSFSQTTPRQNYLQPTIALASSSVTPEDINVFRQLKYVDINSPFLRAFKYSVESGDSNNGKNDNNSSRQFKQTDINNSFQKQRQYASNIGGLSINRPDSHLEVTHFDSPILSEFAEYNLKVQKYANIYPRLYDVSFSPGDIREIFYNEAIYFALENGLYEVGSLPQRLADAAAHAFPNLTPLDYFTALSNTLEMALQAGGIAIDKNYQVLARSNTKYLKDATDFLKVNNAQSALHAIIVATGKFFKFLNLYSPDEIKYILSTLADQLSNVLKKEGVFKESNFS